MSCSCVHPHTHPHTTSSHIALARTDTTAHSGRPFAREESSYWLLSRVSLLTLKTTHKLAKMHHSTRRTRVHGYGDSVHAGLRAAQSLPSRACALLSRAAWAGSPLPVVPAHGGADETLPSRICSLTVAAAPSTPARPPAARSIRAGQHSVSHTGPVIHVGRPDTTSKLPVMDTTPHRL